MITLEDIINLHEKSIIEFGGVVGLRDKGLLESAISRPFQTFERKELYKSPFEKAAALGESLIINHPFIDGNKRIGLLAIDTLMISFGYLINAHEDVLYNLIIQISKGEIHFDEIVLFIKDNSIKI
jgi:death-on-curing protein